MRLAESYEKEGAFVKAAASYEGAIKLNPNLLPATIKLAELYSGPLQASDKALQFASKARELAPNDPKVLAILGKAAYQSGNFAWAYSLLQESARQLPNDHEVLHDLAWAAYSLGQVEKARQTMQSVLATAPGSDQASDAKLFLNMTALTREDGASKARQADVEQVLQENPAYVPALMAKAALLEEHGESKDAVKIYMKVLERFPDFAPAQKHLALLYHRTLEKQGEAYDLAWKARKTLSEDPELAEILARLSYDRNEFAYAAQLLKQSAEKRPLDPEGLYFLGMAQFKSNDIVQARQSLDQALAAGLPDPLASEARRTMKGLDQSN
jgi:Flp pilus assembly protein TadD